MLRQRSIRSLRRFGIVVVASSALVGSVFLAGCTSPQPITPAVTAHDSAWIDAAIARVGTQSGHDPVIKVAIDPNGATILTRQADTRVQRTWRVPLGGDSPRAVSTASPSPSPTPTPSSSLAATSTSSASASASGTAKATGSTSPRASASATPVFPAPSSAPATPAARVAIDNSYGNMGLGAFGDTQVLPMWLLLKDAGCHTMGWTITATAGWSGTVITKGTCNGHPLTMVNGELLPRYPTLDEQLKYQVAVLANAAPNQVARVTITRTGEKSCPSTMVTDYAVALAGPLHLRTTITCETITTVTLSGGWLPPDDVSIGAIKATAVDAVVQNLSARKKPIASTSLLVQWSGRYRQVVMASTATPKGEPTFDLAGELLK